MKNEVVFFDGEFSSLDPYVGELVSIGVVKEDGEELYMELLYDGEYSDWMKENLVHTLTGPKVSRQEARDALRGFVGEGKPHVCAFVNHFDTVYLAKLFSEDTREGETTLGPFHWMPIDFATMLQTYGYDPEQYGNKDFLDELGVDTTTFSHTHNALDDARLLREVYKAVSSRKS
jgi:hypothetical protein